MSIDAIGSDKCQINFTTPTIISESEVKHRLAESELVVKMAGEIEELKSQVEDLQENLREVLDEKNRLVWELNFASEILSAKSTEKRYFREMKDTED